MCGIVGIFYRFQQRQVDQGLLDRMTDAIAHRGPDDRGTWIRGGAGLGHRRLAIRDLTAAGHQPIHDPRGLVTVVFNGELYNDAELRRELERDHGARFQSTCDTEILPAAFVAWGGRMFDRLEGMFAIAIWDSRDQTLWLARDGAGIKPLFVSADHEVIRFGSELKTLLSDSEQARSLSPAAVHRFLAQGYVSPEATLLNGVGQVAPGSVWQVTRDNITKRTFWAPQRRADIHDMGTALEAFTSVWEPVLESMLPSDVPLGVLQSGGIDSSLITLTLGRAHKLPLFTAGFSEHSHDETALARMAAGVHGLSTTVVPVDIEQHAERTFLSVVHHLDGQLADSSAFAVYNLSREVRRHVTVVFGGDGADEFFGGYPTYRASRVASLMQPFVPPPLAVGMARIAERSTARSEERLALGSVAARFLAGLAVAPGASHAHWRRLVPPDRLERLYGASMRHLLSIDPLADYASAIETAPGGLVDRCLLADQQHYLPADMLMKVDAMSMAHALEVRVPFLDRRVMDFAGRVDARLLTDWVGPHKHLLRRALAERGGPPALIAGKKKGFQIPVAQLLRGPLRALGERVLDRDAERFAPLLSVVGVRELWTEHQERRGNHAYALWTLLTLGVWFEQLGTDARSLLASARI